MAVEYSWPSKAKSHAIGKRVKRLDGMDKSTGKAKYTYDVNLKNQLIAKGLGCPHASCTIKSIDTSAAEKVAGVVEVMPLKKVGDKVEFQGDLIIVVAAESEGAGREGVAACKVEYDQQPVFVKDSDLAAAKAAGRTSKGGGRVQTEKMPKEGENQEEFVAAEIERVLKEAAHVVEGEYGIDVITHCCLEPHGSTVQWDGNKLTAYHSTQNVSGCDEGFANDLKIAASDVEVICNYIGGGFGGKFQVDYWSTAAARISQKTGRPVKLMLDRDQEMKIAGNRPSGYIKVRLGADKDGMITVWDSEHWGTSGVTGGPADYRQIPYVYRPANQRISQVNIKTNNSPQRAWRAPNHPQACAITQVAIDDLAMKMGVDSYDIFMKNLGTDDKPLVAGAKPSVYKGEMERAAALMDWKAKWHPHGKGQAKGSIVDGLGLAIHTWGGGAGQSSCTIKIHPNGDVETTCGTQDLGTGTRTVIALVLAETFGLPYESIRVNIGSSKMPVSGASGGSTTVGGVSESHRRAGQDAFAKIAELVGKKLDVDPAKLEAVNGRVQSTDDAKKSVSWKEACSLLGMSPLEVKGDYVRGTRNTPLSNSQVGGVQMAHVEVDKETGVIKMKKFVAVQDIGLIISPQQAESQINGAFIMGIAYALFEQRINDPSTGAFVNCDLANYKLCRIGDIGEFVVEFYEPESERKRGVIGLGEPPVIAPGAAISNAVANALGVRVSPLPLTPQRVLAALKKKT
ncbi:MAG TPA: xanthine dehydrogenase family protein molybdopterin-binding subunit [Pirellulaceae bacterium]